MCSDEGRLSTIVKRIGFFGNYQCVLILEDLRNVIYSRLKDGWPHWFIKVSQGHWRALAQTYSPYICFGSESISIPTTTNIHHRGKNMFHNILSRHTAQMSFILKEHNMIPLCKPPVPGRPYK